jgi:helix-turn-helix protein
VTPDECAGLRVVATALPPGSTLPVLREWLLDLLEGHISERAGEGETPDLTVAQVAARFGRAESTVRGWILRGTLTGAYRFQGRELRVPPAALALFEANQRPTETPRLRALSRSAPVDWTAYRHAS